MNIFSFIPISGTYTLQAGWTSVLIIPNGTVTVTNNALPAQTISISSSLKLGSSGDIYDQLIINGTASLVVNGSGVLGGSGGTSSATASNGLTIIGKDVQLGGTLTKNTAIDGNYQLNLGQTTALTFFNLYTNSGLYLDCTDIAGANDTNLSISNNSGALGSFTSTNKGSQILVNTNLGQLSYATNSLIQSSIIVKPSSVSIISTTIGNSFSADLKTDNLTASRSFNFPNISGTIALLSDLVTLWDDRGNYNASSNTFPSNGGSGVSGAILKGDIWTISVAGTLGGVNVGTGDTVRALVDNPSTTLSNWAFGESVLNAVTLTGTQTITNKTLTFPIISTINNGGTITIPTGTGTLAFTSNLSAYLPLSGGTMSGTINMGGSNITNGGIITALNGLSTDGTASIFSDTANDRVYLGASAGLQNSGNNVFFSLISAGYGNTGSSCIGIGYSALSANSADANFGLGNYSLQNNTGINNFAAGIYSGNGNTGEYCSFFGNYAGQSNSGNQCYFAGYQSGLSNISNQVKALGQDSAHSNTFSNIFTVSKITDVFWNNIGDQGFATLQNVNVQTAMSLNGINQSAANSIQSFASARGTGSGLPGNLQWMYSPQLASGTTRQSLVISGSMSGVTGIFTFYTGARYNSDLSGTYTARSLVDKAYVDSKASGLPTVTTVTASSTLTYTGVLEQTSVGDTSAGVFTTTLPSAAGNTGYKINLKKIGTGTNTLTIATTSSQTIDGGLTSTISVTNVSITVQSDGSNWILI